MKARPLFFVFAFAAVVLGLPAPAGAHRLDEYLQAARFSIERNHVDMEIDLTPGSSVAARVFSLIDTNRDGRISEEEGRAYADQLRRGIELSVDGVPLALHFAPGLFPEFQDMNAGTGMIRFHAAAEFPAAAPGRHELLYRNTHQPDISVYLSNALVPVDRQIEINAQRRDTSQAELAIDYRVVAKSAWPVFWFLPGAVLFLSVGFGVTQLASWNRHKCPE